MRKYTTKTGRLKGKNRQPVLLYYAFTNSRPTWILTSSLTIRLPASVTPCQERPKSFRLILPLAVIPARVFPQGSLMTPPNSASSFTFLVTPWMVRSPHTSYDPSLSTFSYLEATNFNCGNCAASKKSGDFRCPSRCSAPVEMESTSAVKVTFAVMKSSPSVSTAASNFVNFPLTLEIIICFTLNSTSEWEGSRTHFVAIKYKF